METIGLAAHDLIAAWQDALTETAFPTRLPAVSWIASLTSANEVGHTDAGATLAGQEPHGHGDIAPASGISSFSRIAPGSEAWLRWLAARASALHERLNTPWLSSGIPTDERTLGGRLERWMKYVAITGNREDFLRFLRWEGKDDVDVSARTGFGVPGRGYSPASLVSDSERIVELYRLRGWDGWQRSRTFTAF